MIRRPPRSTRVRSSAASDVYKRQTMRLAFSVAVRVDPDLLIVGEVLAVGDQAFQTKCFERIAQFKRAGKTLFFVSHSPQLVRQFCERTLWLNHGEAVLLGTPDEVLNAYAGQPR